MKITIICLGKLKEKPYQQLETEFLKRLKPFANLNIIELREIPYKDGYDMEKVKKAEAELLQKHISKGSYVVSLDIDGKQMASEDFAKFIVQKTAHGENLVFVIGGSLGLYQAFKDKSDYRFSMGTLTFPHNLARFILIEQVYRALTIVNGKQYHKQ